MGYVCPVCEQPQADAEHLANHLAFTAMLGDADHETFLDDHVPDWAERDPPGLASAVESLAEETDHEPVSEPLDPTETDPTTATPTPPADEETAEILERAKELTEEMYGDDERDENA